MLLFKCKQLILNNVYLLLGIAIGFFIYPNFKDFECNTTTEIILNNVENITNPVLIKANLTRQPSTKKATNKIVRPRYYSTELGIRQKLFVGVITSEEKLNIQAIHINQTVAHLVDKLKFFITTQHKLKTKHNLTGVIGFTDTRPKYRPFQIIKYVGDTFINDYDYYYIMNDFNYLNVRKLKEAIERMSVSQDIYMGTLVHESSYCNLDAGILISNSVLKSMREHLDWCIVNSISDNASENFGRCVHYSIKLSCQNVVQGMKIISYKIKYFSVDKHLKDLSGNAVFNEASNVYPVLESNDFYLLHAYFSKQRLLELNDKIRKISDNLMETWPPGHKVGSKAATRFDLSPQLYFNMTHVFFPDDFTNIRKHNLAELKDIENVLKAVTAKVLSRSPTLEFDELLNGYKAFDLSRGFDYRLDLAYRDKATGETITKRFEVCKPLGKVEFVPAPYVTENNKVTVLLTVQEHEVNLALQFMNNYSKKIMERKERTTLMLVLLYQYETPSKGDQDRFGALKNMTISLNGKYKSDEPKLSWVSIRLPPMNGNKFITLEEYESLNFAVIDLSLKKIGLETIVLVLDPYAEVHAEFLNRVRMNTIINFQIFSPIPFREYDPKVSLSERFDVNKMSGHFDKEEYKYVAFYGKDYVNARKRHQRTLPIVKTDNDIANILYDDYKDVGNVFLMFLQYADNLHCMRATDNLLLINNHLERVDKRANLFIGTKAQLAKWLLTKYNQF